MKTALLVLLFATTAAADTLTDTRVALTRLGARDPIRATYEVQRNVSNEGKFDNDKFVGNAAVELESDGNGLRIIYSRTLLEQVEREQAARQRNGKQVTPVTNTLSEIGPLATNAVVDFAPRLLRMMEGAKVVEDRNGTWAGKPAHILILTLADPPPDNDVGKVSVSENKLTLWLGDGNVPLAAEHLRTAKFSFLVFKGQSKSKRSWHFATVGDRLVTARHEEQETGSGMGQKGNESRVETVKVHP